jgi:hypothetical protein
MSRGCCDEMREKRRCWSQAHDKATVTTTGIVTGRAESKIFRLREFSARQSLKGLSAVS